MRPLLEIDYFKKYPAITDNLVKTVPYYSMANKYANTIIKPLLAKERSKPIEEKKPIDEK